MIDQLINFGPMVSSIIVYNDLYELTGSNCKNIIYKYDGKSEYKGGHAVVIVGYGYQNSKYYWIIQNSWGENFCDNGFAKIEFGEITIENIAFSEPYIESEEKNEEKSISIKLNLRDDCKYEYIYENEDDNGKSFELYFIGDNSSFYYQCNKAPFLNNSKGICNFDFESYNFNEKGIYKYANYNPLFKKNSFEIEFDPYTDNQFYFYQSDFLINIYIGVTNCYISEEGSGILILYFPFSNETKFIPNIYTNNYTKKLIKDCRALNLLDHDYIFCNVSNNEIDYFNKGAQNLSLVYDILCGKKEEIHFYVHQLDKTKYPVLRIKQLILLDNNYVDYYSEFYLVVDIEGSVSRFTAKRSYFITYIQIIKYYSFT